jgi:hypothetical protein
MVSVYCHIRLPQGTLIIPEAGKPGFSASDIYQKLIVNLVN